MSKEELLKEVSQTLTKNKVERLAKLASKANSSVEGIIELTFYEKAEVAFRAAWILECFLEKYPKQFIPHINQFLQSYPRQTNPSCQRHFTKILMSLYTERVIKELWMLERDPIFRDKLKDIHDEVIIPVVEATFQWLIEPDTPVAVKVNCLNILFYFSHRFDWIGEELQAQINFLLRDGSAAMQSRGRKILEKLKEKGRIG